MDRPMDRHTLVHAFLVSRRARSCTPKTLQFYGWCLSKLPEGPLPSTLEEIDLIFATCDLPSRESRHDLWRGLRIFFGWLARRYQIANPMLDFDRPARRRPLPRYIPEERVEAVFAACATSRETALIALLLDTGLRIGEVHP